MRMQQKRGQFTLSKREVQKIINFSLTFRDRCIIETLYYAGLRVSELVALRIEHLDFDRRRITIYHSKGQKTRVLPLTEHSLLQNLRTLIGTRKRGHIFLSRNDKYLSTRMVNKICRKCGERANIRHPNPDQKYINPHLFRHCIARHMKDDGYPMEFIQNFLGHEHFSTTMDTYGTMSLADMEKFVDWKQDKEYRK